VLVLCVLHHLCGDLDTEFLSDAFAVVWVGAEEVAELEHLDFLAGVSQSTRDARGEAVALAVIEQAEKIARLGEVIVIDG